MSITFLDIFGTSSLAKLKLEIAVKQSVQVKPHYKGCLPEYSSGIEVLVEEAVYRSRE